MAVTQDFILALARRERPPPARLVDFGCGRGEVVLAALVQGYDAWGVDTFDDIWSDAKDVARAALGERLRLVESGEPLPFADASVDVVTTNQVFEHLAEPRAAVRELARILRPNGLLIAIFPTHEIVREPHIGAPFVHWLARGSPRQRALLRLCHWLGLHKVAGSTRASFEAHGVDMLTRHIFYARADDVPGLFAPEFRLTGRPEPAYLRAGLTGSRLRGLRFFAPAFFDPLLRWLSLRLANGVFVFRCAASPRAETARGSSGAAADL